ncbi:MAG: GerAB/ArcD/ProY family transporter [Clostridia bacterium]|nr:GerAB/ArcD/ProY family transporter [Clostridia bacterium]
MKLTNQQFFCLMTAFLLGNVLSGIGGFSQGPKTGYLAVLVSYGIFLLFVAIYHIILKRNRYQGLFTIIKRYFSLRWQKVVFAVIATSAFLSALFSICNYTDFITFSTYQKTPIVPCLFFVLLLVLYLCLSREKAMGRYSEIVLPIVLFAIVSLCFYSIRQWNIQNIKTEISALSVLKQGTGLFFGPFSEMVFLYLLTDCLESPKSITKIAVSSGAVVTIIFSLVYLLNLSVLGEALMGISRFPTFTAASVIQVGTIIEKAETLITFSYSFCDILYSAVCLFVCQKSIGNLFPMKQKTKKITACAAVIFIAVIWFILKNTVNTETLYPAVTFALLPLTTGLPIILFFYSKKGSRHSP